MRTSMPSRSRFPGARPRGELGSAYIIVLLVLVVLTILGLSLALVTQTERQIGTSEKTIQRVFSSAETGIALAVAKALVLPDHRGMRLELRESRTRVDGGADHSLATRSLLLRHDVQTSVLRPILDAPCNLCQINSGGSADLPFKEINHSLVSTATRRGWRSGSDPDDAGVIGRQQISLMVELQPWPGLTTTLSDTAREAQ